MVCFACYAPFLLLLLLLLPISAMLSLHYVLISVAASGWLT